MNGKAVAIRAAAAGDIERISEIYAHHVRTGLGTFEETPPSLEEMRRRQAEVAARGLPYLVAIDAEGTVLGYAYAAPFRLRSAYRYTLEDSIYVAPATRRQGIGARLLAALIELCAAAGYRQMVAVIGDSANHASIGLHERAGFRQVGVQTGVGFKFGRWVDSVTMQRPLGAGDTSFPESLISLPSGHS